MTRAQIHNKAIGIIEREESLAHEVAQNKGQKFENVKHMRWFKLAVEAEIWKQLPYKDRPPI